MPMSGEQERPVRVPVVDDSAADVLLLSKSLQGRGYEALTAADGFAALEAAVRETPDLVLLDITMPQRNGFEVCRLLKAQPLTATIPVLFVTAQRDTEAVIQGLSVGGADYITKPFVVREVLARVDVHLRLRQAEQELVRRAAQLEQLTDRLAQANADLAALSRTDALTSLLNRRAWREAAALEDERSRRQGHPYGVAMIDVDSFKSYNDTMGHQAGDECLRRVAAAMTSACRSTDVVARYGGEEFVVLFVETNAEHLRQGGERIRAAVWDLNLPHRASLAADRVTVSVGIASSTPPRGGAANARELLTWERVVEAADKALYAAKKAGRNQVCEAGSAQPVRH